METVQFLLSLTVAGNVAMATGGPPTPPPVHWWEDFRLVQLTVTGALAFLGFTFGTWVKHLFDLRFQKKAREERERKCAGTLYAEVESLAIQAREHIDILRLRLDGGKPPLLKLHVRFIRVASPVIYPSMASDLGLLHSDLANSIALFYSEVAFFENFSNEARAISIEDDAPVEVSVVRSIERRLKRLNDLGDSLASALNAYAHDKEWRTALEDGLAAHASMRGED